MKSIACNGDSASRMCGAFTISLRPSTRMTANQTPVTGPNQRPTPAVPTRWTANKAMMTPSAIGTTSGSKAGVATFRPSTALSTEIAGVSRQSP